MPMMQRQDLLGVHVSTAIAHYYYYYYYYHLDKE